MGHIHSNSEYDSTVSAVIVHNDRTLLLFHHKLQMWLAPAGHVELNEHLIEALYREVEEETGLTKEHLTLISPYDDNLSFEHNHNDNLILPMPFNINVHTVNADGHRHIDFTYLLKSDTNAVKREEDKAEQLQWFTLKEIEKLSPMPKLVYSHAKYALEKAGEIA